MIVNPAAGQDEPILNTLNRIFAPHAIDWSVSVTQDSDDGRRFSRQAVAEGVDLVVAYGGDGTVMEVANGLIDTDVPMAILPGGTGNATAVALGIPQNLEAAARLICAETPALRAVDMGRVRDQWFLLRAGVGFEVEVTRRASREMKDRFGVLAYLISMVQLLDQPQIERYYLVIDGEEVTCEGLWLMIANVGDVGRLNLSLPAPVKIDDGLLDVFVVSSALTMAVGVTPLKDLAGDILHWQAREIKVTADPPQKLQVDGEIVGMTPFTAEVVPQAIRIVVPPMVK